MLICINTTLAYFLQSLTWVVVHDLLRPRVPTFLHCVQGNFWLDFSLYSAAFASWSFTAFCRFSRPWMDSSSSVYSTYMISAPRTKPFQVSWNSQMHIEFSGERSTRFCWNCIFWCMLQLSLISVVALVFSQKAWSETRATPHSRRDQCLMKFAQSKDKVQVLQYVYRQCVPSVFCYKSIL